MKKAFCVFLLGIFLLTIPGVVHSFRCGTRLVQLGDHSFKVLRSCGELISKEVVGFTLSADRTREKKVGNWVYGPEGGFYHILVFEGGILTKITSFRGD